MLTFSAVSLVFSKAVHPPNNAPANVNIINDFLEFLNKLDFSSIISMDGYKFDQNELKLYLAYRVSKVSILEFYMLVKNINLLQLNDEEDV